MSEATAADLAEAIPDGSSVALAPDYSGCSLVTVRALIRRKARNLHLIGVPQLGLQADLLIGGGCVRSIETAAISLDGAGLAPCFERARQAGTIVVREATCPAIHAGLRAAESGVPFMPMRGVIGSDLIAMRDDWVVQEHPFAENDPVLLVPAIRPDVALFHAPLADTCGNVWIGIRRELMVMAHASAMTLVTVEDIVDDDFLADPVRAAGTIPALYIENVARAPGGAMPTGLFGRYPADAARVMRYADAARQGADFETMLEVLDAAS